MEATVLDGASALIMRGQKSTDKEDVPAREAGLEYSKSFSCSDARALCKLIHHDHPELNASPQCVRLDLQRPTPCHRTTPLREPMLQLMARIDALDLEAPCSGSRRRVNDGASEGIPISRDRVRNPMHRIGLRAI